MDQELSPVARHWWLLVLVGVIFLAVGIAAIAWPDITLLAIGVIFGIYLLVAAIVEIVDAVAGPPGSRAASAILAVLALIAGLICIRRPGDSLTAIVIVVGIFLVAAGVLHVVFGLVPPLRMGMVIGGGIEAIAGVVVLVWPNLGLATLALIFALTMLARGAVAVVAGFKLRGLRHDEPVPA
jgi:uncharacterized membrane protein HdeD (DUF308 family)